MKPARSFEPHLAVKRLTLPAGGEWRSRSQRWSFLQISEGVGYWLHPRTTYDLEKGAVLVLSGQALGTLRASQLGEVQVRLFEVCPERLTGLVSFGEQRLFQTLAGQEQFAVRHFPPNTAFCEKFRLLCEQTNDGCFAQRVQLLELFAQAFGNHLSRQASESLPVADAKARLQKVLNEVPTSELLELDFTDLVRQMGCTPRHLSRVFREVVGMSFREKQAQVRMLRAQELLATTHSKVVEVALESGYQSLSLFNLMFKRRFGVSPAQWRERARKPKAVRPADPTLRILRA